jgi:hypothetical protein
MTNGSSLALAAGAAAQVDKRLAAIEHLLTRHLAFVEGKNYFELEWSVAVAKEETSKAWSEQIPQGYIFLPQRLAIQAPEGSRLQLFTNNESAANFVEVVSNVQEYSEGILGPWVTFGPARILAVITKAKVAGTATLTLSGNLILREPTTPVSHIP